MIRPYVSIARRPANFCLAVASCMFAAWLLVSLSACGAARPDSKKVDEHPQLRETLTLTVHTADGRTFKLDVSRRVFDQAGFLAAGGDVCPPPHEKVSDKCVKCSNGNVACRD